MVKNDELMFTGTDDTRKKHRPHGKMCAGNVWRAIAPRPTLGLTGKSNLSPAR
jgi:hypothetical protein